MGVGGAIFLGMVVIILALVLMQVRRQNEPIFAFEALPASIRVGESALLVWKILEAETCTGSWDDQPIALEGRYRLFPADTNEYAITCTSGSGAQTKIVKVVVTVEAECREAFDGACSELCGIRDPDCCERGAELVWSQEHRRCLFRYHPPSSFTGTSYVPYDAFFSMEDDVRRGAITDLDIENERFVFTKMDGGTLMLSYGPTTKYFKCGEGILRYPLREGGQYIVSLDPWNRPLPFVRAIDILIGCEEGE